MRRVPLALVVTLTAWCLAPALCAAAAETDPVAIREVKPAYPKAALKDKKEGTVLVAIEVLPNGQVGTARVTQSLSPALDGDSGDHPRTEIRRPLGRGDRVTLVEHATRPRGHTIVA